MVVLLFLPLVSYLTADVAIGCASLCGNSIPLQICFVNWNVAIGIAPIVKIAC